MQDLTLHATPNGYVTRCVCEDHPPILLAFGNIAVYLEEDAFLGLIDFLYDIDVDCFKNHMPNGRKIVIQTGHSQMYWLMNEAELTELKALLSEAVLTYKVQNLMQAAVE